MVAQVGRFGPRASAVAKGQVRSNREKKKPKADTNKIKAAPTASPFAAPRFARHGSGAAGQRRRGALDRVYRSRTTVARLVRSPDNRADVKERPPTVPT